jgi:hypothetical protein
MRMVSNISEMMKCMGLLDWEQREMRIVFIVIDRPPHSWWQNGNKLVFFGILLKYTLQAWMEIP